MDKEHPKTAAANQDSGGRDGKNEAKGGLWQYQVPPQDPGAGTVQSNAGHYTGGAHGGDSQAGDFLASSPEANAMPAGAAQTSRGSAGRPETGGGGDAGTGGSGGSGASGGAGPGSGDGGAAGVNLGGAGAGAGKTPGTPGGNGTPDEPIWGS